MLFSVIIPAYNRAPLLREALASVFAQTFTDFEVIVVDDGSTDDTEAVCRSFGDRVLFLRQENQGPGAARNRGIASAKGRYLAFLDSDDLWFPWTLDVYHQAIQKVGAPSVVAGHSVPLNPGSGIEPVANSSAPLEMMRYANFFAAWECGHGFKGTPGLAVETSVLKSVGGFLSAFVNGEDQDLCLRLGMAPLVVQILSPPVFRHRTHAGHLSLDVRKAVAGAELLLARESRGEYPGGRLWRAFRRRIVSGAARSASIQSAEGRQFPSALRLFLKTFLWQLRLGRFRYALGFPLFLLGRLSRRDSLSTS